MPLQKQVIQLPYGGLQTKVDPKVAPLGTYAQIDNMVMTRYPELKKRDGLQIIGELTTPANINASYNYLNEIGVITNNALYSYSPSLDAYQLKGLTASPVVSSKPIIANTYTQTVPDGSITANNLFGCIWEDSRGGVRFSVKDIMSDTFLVTDNLISATGIKPKVVAYKEVLYFFYIEPSTTSLHINSFDTVTNSLLQTSVITPQLQNCWTYDILQCFDNILITAVQVFGGIFSEVYAYYWNTSKQQIGGIVNGLPDPRSLQLFSIGVLPPALNLSADPNNQYFTCSFISDNNEVWTRSYYGFLDPISAETQIATALADPGWAISTCLDEVGNLYVFYSSKSTVTGLHNSFQAKLQNISNPTPTPVYNQPFYLQLGVMSTAFWYSGNAYVVLGYDSQLQNTYFGVRDDGACFARLYSQLGGGNLKKANSTAGFQLIPGEPNSYLVPLLKTTKIVSSANSYFSTTSVYTEKVFFTPKTIDNKVLGKYLNIAGGYLKQYDGSPTVFEQGFHLYPEKPVLVQSTGGSIVNGSYSYVACWEWTDNQGQIHRSEPSVPQTVVTTGSNGTVTVTVRTLTITNKETRFGNLRTPVVLAIYRTLDTGTTYYRVNQVNNAYVYNDPTVQTIQYVDTMSDTVLGANALLYTTGGVFQNIAIPSTNLMTVGKNRVIIAGADTEPSRVFYSKEKEEGVAVEFSNELSIIVDSLGGDITALATLDDKILVFKKSLIFYVNGSALLDKLGNGTSPIPVLISSDTGCNSPQSIVLTGDGIMFESQKGIYLCDRQLNVTYVGQALDAITTNNPDFKISSAVNLPDQNRVYFTDLSGQILTYDTFFQQWYTHKLPFIPTSSTILNNNWYVSSSNQVYQAVPGLATDAGKSIQSRIKTNWMSLANLEGFSRIYAILILGENADLEHRLRVNLYYDFETFPRESLSIVPTSLLGAGYGVESPYGSAATGIVGLNYGDEMVYGDSSFVYGSVFQNQAATPYGGFFDGSYQFMVRPREQKCTSIMIEIFDEFPTGDNSVSFKFSGLSLVAGIKQGWNKNLSYTKRLR